MIYDMVQNKWQEDTVHSIMQGAVESERKFMCRALPVDLEEPILIDEGFHTEVACMTYGMVQNKLQKNSVPSTLKRAKETVGNFICEALPCNSEEPIPRDER